MDKDSVGKRFLGRDDVSAELINGYLYGGREVVKAEDLTTISGEEISASPTPGNDHFSRRRDVLKQAVIKEDGKRRYIIFGIEHQSSIDNSMPLRIMQYDSMRYMRELEKLLDQKAEKAKADGKNYKPKLSKKDKLPLVVTLVVYFGKEKWNGYTSLHEMLNEHNPDVLAMTPNYKLNLLHIYNISNKKLQLFKSEFGNLVRFVNAADDEGKFNALCQEVGKLKQETVDLINVLTGSALDTSEVDVEGSVNVCKAIDSMISKAKVSGKLEQAMATALNMHKEGMSVSLISKCVDFSEKEVNEWLTAAAI